MTELEKGNRSHLVRWGEDDYEYCFEDQLCRYWCLLELDHWWDMHNESRSLYNELFEYEVEEDSPIDNFLKYMCIASFDAAIKTVCEVQHIDRDTLMEQIDQFWAGEND